MLDEFQLSVVHQDLEDLKATVNIHHGTQNNFTCGRDYTKYLLLQSAFQNAGNVLFSINSHSQVLKDGLAEENFHSLIKTMLKIASDIPLVANEITDLQVVTRMSQWQLARSFCFLYQWYTSLGPNVIEPLIKLHSQKQAIKNTSLHMLVDHVMKFALVFTSRSDTRVSSKLLLVHQIHPSSSCF